MDHELKLRQSEERFTALMDLSSEVYWEQDDQYRFTVLLGRLEETGLDSQAFLGATRWDGNAVPVGDGGSWDAHKSVLAARQPFSNFLYKRTNARCEVRYLSSSGQPISDASGNFIGYRGMSRDFTRAVTMELRHDIQQQLTRILAVSYAVAEAIPWIISVVCDKLGWACGARWDIEGGSARRAETWSAPSTAAGAFLAAGAEAAATMTPATVVGRAWASGAPAWIEDLATDPGFERRAEAAQAGLRSAFAFPILADGKVRGVLEFYSSELRGSDAAMLVSMLQLGEQIGNFLRRKEAEEALRRSKDVLEQTFEYMDQGISIYDNNLIVLGVNRRFRELLGMPEALCQPGTPFEEQIRYNAERGDYGPGDVGEQVKTRVELARRFQPHCFERERPDGTIVEIRGLPVPGGGFVSVFTDVTKRARAEALAEERLRQSKDLLEKTFEYMEQGIGIVDADLKVIGTNRRLRELLGFPEALCKPGTAFEDLIRYNASRGDYGPGDIEEQVKERVGKAREFQPHHFERERPDGTVLEIRGYHVPGTGSVSIYTDVTKRARAERAVRESEGRFRNLTELSSDWYWEQDENLHFTALSDAAQAKSGYTAESSLGKALWELPDTTPASDSWDELKAAMAARKTFRDFECRHTGAGEAVHFISVSGMPILLENGGFRGYRGTGRDITEKKWSEDLAKALAASEEVSRVKSEFLANMSHELRTPLNAILGFTELVHGGEMGPVSPDQLESLGHVLTGGRRLLRLINDVLDLAKVESGKLKFHPEPVDVPEVVGEVISNLGIMAADSRIQVRVEVDETIGSVFADAARLKQVLHNYISNALKFTPPGGSVVVRARPEGPEAFVFEVEDSGVGIKPEDLARLFVEFQQLDAGYAKKYAGTGLGLAFTKRLVEAQGGSVGVRSTPGQGSVFHAIFPRKPIGAGA